MELKINNLSLNQLMQLISRKQSFGHIKILWNSILNSISHKYKQTSPFRGVCFYHKELSHKPSPHTLYVYVVVTYIIWYLSSRFCNECNVFIKLYSFFEKYIPFLEDFCKAHNLVRHLERVTHREIEEYERNITKHSV